MRCEASVKRCTKSYSFPNELFEGYAAAGVMVVLKRFSYEGGLKLASLERRAGEAQPERRHDRGRDMRADSGAKRPVIPTEAGH